MANKGRGSGGAAGSRVARKQGKGGSVELVYRKTEGDKKPARVGHVWLLVAVLLVDAAVVGVGVYEIWNSPMFAAAKSAMRAIT